MWNRKPAKSMLEALWSRVIWRSPGARDSSGCTTCSERVIPAAYLEAPVPTETESLRAVSTVGR